MDGRMHACTRTHDGAMFLDMITFHVHKHQHNPTPQPPTRGLQDGRAYIGGFEGYKGRKGLGFTVTKMGKGLIADRDGNAQIGGGLIIDFNARSYRRTSAAGGEEAEVSLADSAKAAGPPGTVPEFWDEEGVYGLLRAAVDDPEANYAAMDAFTRALRAEQGVLLEEEPPRVPIPAYTRERACLSV